MGSEMKILWIGDAVVSTGFSKCTHTICDKLHKDGWEVHVLGINYFGDPHDYPYTIYPCYNPLSENKDFFGVYRIPEMLTKIDPDVVVILNDPWNVPNYITAVKYWAKEKKSRSAPVVVGWLAVDAKNQPQGAVDGLDHIVTWVKFAERELRCSGYQGPMSVVPLGVDREIFCRHDRDVARSRIKVDNNLLSEDDFIVGCVGRNQFRKRLDLTIEYFAEFVDQCNADNAKLFIHSAPTGDSAFDIDRLAEYYGVRDRLIESRGVLGFGLDTTIMPVIYSAMDVFLTTTQGEGWGLCTLEAMSCGIPCIIPNWSGLGDWARESALTVPCTSSSISAPLNVAAYTVGGVPDKAKTVQALSALYREPVLREDYRDRGLKRACTLSWDRCAWEFQQVLDSIMEGV